MFRQMSGWALAFACTLAPVVGAEENKRAKKLPLDREFLIKAVTCSHADVQFAELADKRAGSDKVKELARTIAQDHTKMNEALSRLAKDRKLAVLAGTEAKTRDETKRLGKLEGSDFDREYLKRVITDHEHGLRMFEAQVKDGDDKDLSSFAKKTLPDLKNHLRQARKLLSSLKNK